MDTREAVERFLIASEAKGLRTQTINSYRYWLEKFQDHSPEIPSDPLVIETFIARWQGVTRKNAYRAISVLITYLIKARLIDPWANPLQFMDRPKARRTLPRIFTPEETQRIFDAARPVYERALILTLYDSMARIGELVGREKRHISSDGLLVDGKVGPRMVPLLPSTVAYLKELPSAYLFPAKDKHGRYLDQPAHVNTLKNHFAAIIDRAGITGRRRGPHTIRHTAATAWLRSSGDIFALKQVLGHSSVKETEIYVALLRATELADAHRQHSALLQFQAARQFQMAL